MKHLYLGVDPGVNGGLACIDSHGDTTRVIKMPGTDTDLWLAVSEMSELGEITCVLEKISSAPRRMGIGTCKRCGNTWPESKAMNSPKSMLTQGTNYGTIRMALLAAGIRFDEVGARKWQGIFGLVGHGKETTTEKKNRHKDAAQKLFPSTKVTHYVADALLLAEYCKRIQAPPF